MGYKNYANNFKIEILKNVKIQYKQKNPIIVLSSKQTLINISEGKYYCTEIVKCLPGTAKGLHSCVNLFVVQYIYYIFN